MTAERWERLAAVLTTAGYPATVTARTYPGGVSRSITIRLDATHLIEVRDSWWRGHWAGYQVWLEDADSIQRAYRSRMKNRGRVVDAVRDFSALTA
jgi:hypothetical protein